MQDNQYCVTSVRRQNTIHFICLSVRSEELSESSESSNRLEVYICYLRKKLEQLTGIRLIRTVRGIGYRLD